MKVLLSLFIVILINTNTACQSAREIVRKSRQAVQLSSFEAVSTLIISDNQGNERIRRNTMASKTFEDSTEKRIIKFLAPAEVEGTGILIFDYENEADDMWVYLPALRKTRRIVSSEKSSSFMGSEFSNADMTVPSLEDFKYNLLGTEKTGGVDCWKIESVPVNMDKEEEFGYSRSVRWIGRNDFIVRKSAYFGHDRNLIKEIETIEFELLDIDKGKYMITDMLVNNFRNGRSSRMKMDEIEIAETDDSYFTVSYLER